MSREEFNARMKAGTLGDFFKEQDERNRRERNAEIDRCGGAYRLMDRQGNEFVFYGLSKGGFAEYRCRNGGLKVIDKTHGYTVVQQYDEE